MSFPTTMEELKAQGYKFGGEAQCKGCGEDIEWWTTPRGKKMPCDVGTATPHWSTCPNAKDFKSDSTPTSKVTSATLDIVWMREQATTCHCNVCKYLRSHQ